MQNQNTPIGCTASWDCLRTDDGDTAYLDSTSTTTVGPRVDLYTLDDVGTRTEPIATVVISVVSRSVQTAHRSSVTPLLKIAGLPTLFSAAAFSPASTYSLTTSTYSLNPATNLPWTWDDINNLEAGVQHRVAIGDEVRTTSLRVDVCWIPSPGSPTLFPSPSPTPTTATRALSGKIRYYSSAQPVDGAMVHLDGPTADMAQTDSSGQFSFSGLDSADWQVQPNKMGDAGAAITSLDAVYVLQAMIGTRVLTREQQLACDVSGDGRLTGLDAALILQYKLGLLSHFPAAALCGSDWIFMPEPAPLLNQELMPPTVSTSACQSGAIAFHPLMYAADNQNFVGVLLGDCTGNWEPAWASTAGLQTDAATPDVRLGRPRTVRGGRRVRVPLSVAAQNRFTGFNVELRYDPAQLSIHRVRRGRGGRRAVVVTNERAPGVLAVSVASGQALHGDSLLVLEFDARHGAQAAAALTILHADVE